MRSLLLLLGLAACNPPPPAAPPPTPGTIAEPGETVMTVNGTPVGGRELDLVFHRARVNPAADPRSAKHIAEEYAAATLLYQKGLEQKVYDDPVVQLQMAFAVRQVIAAAARDELGKSAVTDAAVDQWYQQNKARFDKPEVKARMILVPSESQAKDLVERVKKGEDFAALAKAHSVDPRTKAQGGDLGWFKEQEVAEIGDDAFGAKKGDLLGPIEGRLGFYVVEVQDRRDATPLEEVRPEAEAQLAHAEGVRQIEQIRQAMKIEWIKPLPDAPIGAAMPLGLPAGHPETPGGGAPPHGGGAPVKAPHP